MVGVKTAVVGVPEIAPVIVLKDKPIGSVGVIAKLAIAPPVEAIAVLVKALPTVAVSATEV